MPCQKLTLALLGLLAFEVPFSDTIGTTGVLISPSSDLMFIMLIWTFISEWMQYALVYLNVLSPQRPCASSNIFNINDADLAIIISMDNKWYLEKPVIVRLGLWTLTAGNLCFQLEMRMASPRVALCLNCKIQTGVGEPSLPCTH